MLKAQRLSTLLVAVLLVLGMAPWVFAQATPSLTVGDQAIEDDTVMIDQVVSDGPGWIVIHIDNNGSPGQVIGWEAVEDGENNDVAVEIDPELATETLHAMLHIDVGTEGTYEFPGADAPVQVSGVTVVEAFTVTGLPEVGEAPAGQAIPALTVGDQAIEDDTVTIDQVISDGPGWIVIHVDNNGSPGQVIGWEAVTDGENNDVVVEIDPELATETLHAMLHTDAGTEGTYEFPGADAPVQVDGATVVEPFTITSVPPAMPETGSVMAPSLQVSPTLTVTNQSIEDGILTVDSVTSDGPGWVVVHEDDNGEPGEIIGNEAVPTGTSTNVDVDVETDVVTGTVHVALHTDAGTAGTFEPDGADVEVVVNGQPLVRMVTLVQEGEQLPETGGLPAPWMWILIGSGILLIGAGILLRRS